MRTPLILAATAALAIPAVSLAEQPSSTDTKNAAKECKALQAKSDTADNFRSAVQELVGPKVKVTVKNAYGKCVSFKARDEAREHQDSQQSAAKACRTERNEDAQAFREKYGTGNGGKNAFGKCVSQHAKAAEQQADEQDAEQVNAAQACRKEQKKDAAAFRKKYGTNRNGRNAFGKCVSKTARQS